MVVDFAEDYAQLREVCLLVGFVQILPQRIGKRAFPFSDGCAQIFERVHAELKVDGRPVGKELPLCGNNARNAVGGCIFHIF